MLPRLAYPRVVPLHPAACPPRPRRRRQGPGDPGPAPAAHRPAPPGPTTEAVARRPRLARCGQPDDAPIPLVLLPGRAGDLAALASAHGRRCLDLPTPWTRATAAGRGSPAADRAPSPRESPLGLPAHPRRTAAAWRAGLGHRHPHNAPPPPAWPCPTVHDTTQVAVRAPNGWHFVDAPPGSSTDRSQARWTGLLDRERTIVFTLEA